MKILQIASYYAPTIGGMETVLRDLAEGLVASGDEVTVLCSAEGVRGRDELVGGVRVIRLRCLRKVLSQPISVGLPFALRRLAGDADVVHLHMPNPLAEAATLSLPREVPLVATYHTDIVRQRFLRPLYGPIRRAVLERSRTIVVPTEDHVTCSEILPAFSDKCTVVPFGIARARYQLDDAARQRVRELRARYGRFVLFVGRLVYYKGVDALVEAARDVDAQLVIVGDGPLRQSLRAQIDAAGLSGRITMLGALDQADLNPYFEACELLVLPSVSRSEGFGITLLEGMSFGKPLITTRLPSGFRAVNEDGHTGVQVPPRDPAALAAALRTLLADDGLRARMGSAARARLDSHFSLERMIGGYRAVYQAAGR